MKNIINKSTKKKILSMLGVIAIITVAVGLASTLALFTSSDASGSQTFTTGTLKILYTNGSQINDVVLVPIADETGASEHTFTITNTGNIEATYKIDFTEISLTKKVEGVDTDTTSANIKWKLYKATKTGNNYSIDTGALNGGLVASGDFSAYDKTDPNNYTLPIASTNLELKATGDAQNKDKQDYILRIWLANASDNSEDQGLTFSAKVKVTATQK